DLGRLLTSDAQARQRESKCRANRAVSRARPSPYCFERATRKPPEFSTLRFHELKPVGRERRRGKATRTGPERHRRRSSSLARSPEFQRPAFVAFGERGASHVAAPRKDRRVDSRKRHDRLRVPVDAGG